MRHRGIDSLQDLLLASKYVIHYSAADIVCLNDQEIFLIDLDGPEFELKILSDVSFGVDEIVILDDVVVEIL
jgi:hypothetical protein